MKNTIHRMAPVRSYVAVFDILGFSQLVNTQELQRVTATYRSMLTTFRGILTAIGTLLPRRNAISFTCFSDSLVIYTVDTSTAGDGPFSLLMIGCAALFLAANAENLRLRGAVAFGEIYKSGNVVIGKPVVEASRLEKDQDWIGCCIGDGCCEKIRPQIERYTNDLNIIIEYEVPLKAGPVTKMYAFNWVKAICFNLSIVNPRADLSVEQVSSAVRFLALNGGEDWEVRRKINNTITFRDAVLTSGFVEQHNTWIRTHFPSQRGTSKQS